MVIDHLGPSIHMLFESHKQPFGVATVSEIGIKMLDRLRVLHEQDIVHCDIKPGNIVIGCEAKHDIFLLDFGLAKHIPNADKLEMPFKINALLGSFKYMSTGAHKNIVSFRNDIESLGYVLAYLIRGNLPWEENELLKLANQNVITILNGIYQLKESGHKELLDSLPTPIKEFLAASKAMSHLERPDYEKLAKLLKLVFCILIYFSQVFIVETATKHISQFSQIIFSIFFIFRVQDVFTNFDWEVDMQVDGKF